MGFKIKLQNNFKVSWIKIENYEIVFTINKSINNFINPFGTGLLDVA